ncbi:MAG: single-stranded-DNA-specific exonuclease RecJ [Rickettsiales bacterium]
MTTQSSHHKLSILQKNWQEKIVDERLAISISKRFSISEILAKLLIIREVEIDNIHNFLEPKIKNILPDPFLLGSMSDAVEGVIFAIKNQKKICIFGDYDVDGATSSALLKKFFYALNIEVEIYIPDRILEGYGPNSNALVALKNKGVDLVIMVDCGTVAFEPLKIANKIGLEIIVIDHHLGVLEKPEAIAVINPNLINESFEHKNLCAAGVVFLFLVAINKELRRQNYFTKQAEPNLYQLLDLVALGTVCDVMTLTGLNRCFVANGLKIMQKRQNVGLKTIIDLAGVNSELNSYTLGFIIGPRINAGGRVGSSHLGAEILSTEDENLALEIASKLEELNKNRKDIEAEVLNQAIYNLENKIDGYSCNDAVIFAVGINWHQGVIGIIASRLKELYQKPVAVITIDDKTNKAKGSCRSILGIDFGAEILNAKIAEIIIEGGGHAMAGGFSLSSAKIKEFHNFLNQKLQNKITQILENNVVNYDLKIDAQQLNLDLVKEISKLEPFGVGNPRPKFLIENLYKIKANFVGKQQEHLSLIFGAKSLIGYNNNVSGILFRQNQNNLAKFLLESKNSQPLNLIATIEINSWMGVEKLQLQIEDAII